RVADDDEVPATGPAGEVARGGDVVYATGKVVRLAVADPHRRDAVLLGQLDAERVVHAVGRTEHPAHASAARQHDVGRVAGAVPQDRQQAAQRVDLEMRERR